MPLRRCRSFLVPAAIGLYVAVLSWACHAKFVGYAYGDFDLAIDAQTLWNILHGSIESSIHRMPFLGNHMRLILFVVAPLYAVCQTPLMLLYLQTAVLGAGAWGIYLMAREEIPHVWATWLALLYLVYPPLIYLNLYEFHPIAMAATFIIWTLYFYKIGRFRLFVLFLLLALACQENVALISLGLGVYALVDRRRGKWCWLPALLGIGYFALAVFVIMPHFNTTIQWARLYGHLGDSLPDVFKGIILHPLRTLRCALAPGKVAFLNALLAPVGYLSLLSPVSLIPVSLVLGQRLLSIRPSETSIAYHYQAEFVPFIFFSAIYGAKRLLGLKSRIVKPAMAGLLVVFPLIAVVACGLVPTLLSAVTCPGRNKFLRDRKDAVVRTIPCQARVLATFDTQPRLANRAQLFSLHHVYCGHYTLSDLPYPIPEVDYIVMDTADRLTFSESGFYGEQNYLRLQAALSNANWRVFEHIDSLLVLERAGTGTNCALGLVKYTDLQPGILTNIVQSTPKTLSLVGYEIAVTPEDSRVAMLVLYWLRMGDSVDDHCLSVTLHEEDVTICQTTLCAGSRIWPPQSWPIGQCVADRHRIHLDAVPKTPSDVRLTVSRQP